MIPTALDDSSVAYPSLNRNTLGRLGFGAAPIGLYPEQVSNVVAQHLLDRAWELGMRYFDTAPFYGGGLSECRLGEFVARHNRSHLVVSTKVGRRLATSRDSDAVTENGTVFDFDHDGIAKQFDDSCDRLGVDYLDICYLHDPDNHISVGLSEAFPTLHTLRAQGRTRAIGVGTNHVSTALAFARDCELDVILLANSFTLLRNLEAIESLLPLCQEKDIALVIGGVFNSGVLATGADGLGQYDYGAADNSVLAKVRLWEQLCNDHEIALGAAAIAFALRDANVISVLLGVRSVEELEQDIAWGATEVPDSFWSEAVRRGMIKR